MNDFRLQTVDELSRLMRGREFSNSEKLQSICFKCFYLHLVDNQLVLNETGKNR